MDRVMLFSGGLDCFILWRLSGMPRAVYYNLGHRYATDEMIGIHRILTAFPFAKIHIDSDLKLGQFEDPGGSYIPFRNLLMLLHAHQKYPADAYMIGQVLEWETDKNPGFYRETERLFTTLGKRPARIEAPFARLTKTAAVAKFIRAGFDPRELTTFTRSCVTPGTVACGKCANCFYRWIALKNNGLAHLERYARVPSWDDAKHRLFHRGWRFIARHPLVFLSRLDQARRAFACT